MANYDDLIEAAAKKYNVDAALVKGVIRTESGGNPKALSEKGAKGLMQLIDPTAKAYGVKDVYDPAQNIDAGTRLLAENLDRFGNVQDALRAYHGGLDKKAWGEKTQAYPGKVMANLTQAAPKNLPGIPESTSPNADAIFAQRFGSAVGTAAPAKSADPAEQLFAQRFGSALASAPAGKPSGGANPAATPQGQVTPPKSIIDTLKSMQAGKISPQELGLPTAGTGAFATGASDPYYGGQQLVAHGLAAISDKYAPEAKAKDAEIAAREQAYQAARQQAMPPTLSGLITGEKQAPGVDWGRLAGNVASGVFMPGGAPASFAGKLGLSALQGGVFGAVQPVTDTSKESFGSQKAGQVGYSVLGGLAAPAVANVVGGVVSPRLAEGANALREAGVKLTPGQAFGGAFKALEDKLTSAPLLGDLIKNAQRGSVEDFNRAAYQRALDPIGEKVTAPVGREAIEQVSDKLSAAYNKLLPKMTFAADQQFQSDMANVAQVATSLAEPQFKQLGKILENDLLRHMTPQGTMSGESLKKVENALTQKARTYQSSAVGSERELGDAISSVLQSVRNSLQRSNPQYAAELGKINQGYANYARIRQAAAMTGAEHGVFTPAQLQNAVKSADKSVAKGNFAKGNALMQDLSEAGKSVLGNQYPDSGTPGRLFVGGLAGSLLGGGTAMGAVHPGVLAAGAAAAAPYTSVGKAAFNALLNRPAAATPVAESVRRNLPRLLVPLTPAALTMGQ